MIKAEVIAHSIDPLNREIVTMIVTLPRIILAEFNTHRVFSRNSASSRAIPTSKFLQMIDEDPFVPTYWGKNQAGMQAEEEINIADQEKAKKIWLKAKDKIKTSVSDLQKIGIHKQITNRLLEPWFYTTILVTSTEWLNFFKLRCHKDAQPEIRIPALAMQEAYLASVPKKINFGDWHIPFGDRCEDLTSKDQLRVATARAARLSYVTFDGKIDYEKDFKLHDDLMTSGHWSPFEHCAQSLKPLSFWERLKSGVRFIFGGEKYIPNLKTGNFRGYMQYRKLFFGESGE